MKKLIFVLMILFCTAMVFAYQGDMSAGISFGYGGFTQTVSSDANNKVKIDSGGYYVAGVFEYCIADDVYVKAEAGVNKLSDYTYKGTVAGESVSNNKIEGSAAMHLTVYTGVRYKFNLFGDVGLSVGGGFEAKFGKEGSSTEDKLNIAGGPAAEVMGLLDNEDSHFKFGIGARMCWALITTDKSIGQKIIDAPDKELLSQYLTFRYIATFTYSF